VSETLFFRLLAEDDKGAALADAVAAVRAGAEDGAIHAVDPASFRQVPTSPFAYWVSERLRRVFTELPRFESNDRTVKQGLATADDFRFVRAWWEVAPERILDAANGPHHDIPSLQRWCRERTFQGKRWAPFAKGGEYSPYYADVYLVVNWERDGEEIRSFVGPGGRLASRPQNVEYYFRPGLTWPRRTQRGLSFRPFPAGCVFADKGPVAFAETPHLRAYLLLTNSTAFKQLVSLHMAFGSYEVGVIQRTALPEMEPTIVRDFDELSSIVDDIRWLDMASETSRVFLGPGSGELVSRPIQAASQRLGTRLAMLEQRRRDMHQRIDDLCFQLYGFTNEERLIALTAMQAPTDRSVVDESEADEDAEESGEGPNALSPDPQSLARDLLSYAVGCLFGRWDARIGRDPSLAPKLADPFAPLPVCSPGMLFGPDGLPAKAGGIVSEQWLRARPDAITLPPEGTVPRPTIPGEEYPIPIAWDGILVDDPDHPDDIVRRVHGVLELLWGERAEAIEREACGLLGVKELRDYFRNPRGFWDDHVRRYSKKPRKAPIYWLLQSRNRSYALWLYCHRLSRDTLPRALVQHVEPKLRLERGRLDQLRAQRAQAGTTGAAARQVERAIERQEALLSELEDFREKLERVIKLGLTPDLDDGIVLTIAPLWELVPWKVAKDYWQELTAGKYPWSSIGKQLRAKGLVR